MSMAPELITRGAKLTIECMDRLVPLAARSFPEATVVARRDPPQIGGDFNFQATGMALACHLRPNMDVFPRRASFLKADPEKTAHLRERYKAFGRRRIVGLSWYTSSRPWGTKRSIPLPGMLVPLDLKDMLIVDLQYGETAGAWAEARKAFPDLAAVHDNDVDQMMDMDSYAAQVAACDFVFTIANTTSHVAGALGVPAAVLMPEMSLPWYWFAQGETCFWYPSLTLLRYDAAERLERAAALAAGGNLS
jgi:hypothetical protein